MRGYLKNYLKSFRLKKEHAYIFLVDVLFMGIVYLLFTSFNWYLDGKMGALSAGKGPEQIQQMMLAMGPEQLQAFMGNLTYFLVFFLVGLVLLVGLTWSLLSLSRGLIWNKLLGRKLTRKNYWRWNWLNLALIVPLVGYLMVGGAVKLVLLFVFKMISSNLVFLEIANALTGLLIGLLFLVFLFSVYYSFTIKYRVWESIGEAFHLLKTRWKRIWPALLLVWLTSLVMALVLWPISKLFVYRPQILFGINIGISLLFLSWMRVYFFRAVKG